MSGAIYCISSQSSRRPSNILKSEWHMKGCKNDVLTNLTPSGCASHPNSTQPPPPPEAALESVSPQFQTGWKSSSVSQLSGKQRTLITWPKIGGTGWNHLCFDSTSAGYRSRAEAWQWQSRWPWHCESSLQCDDGTPIIKKDQFLQRS